MVHTCNFNDFLITGYQVTVFYCLEAISSRNNFYLACINLVVNFVKVKDLSKKNIFAFI